MGSVPEELRRFVRTYIRSMLQLEGLLLVAGDPERWWSADVVNRELRSSEQACLIQLERLVALGLLESRGSESGKVFRLGTEDPQLRAQIAALGDLHRRAFHALIDVIYAADRAQEFADAFRLGKGRDDG